MSSSSGGSRWLQNFSLEETLPAKMDSEALALPSLQRELTIFPFVCGLSGFPWADGDGGGLKPLRTRMPLPSCQKEKCQEAEGPRCFPLRYASVWPLKHRLSLLRRIVVSCQVLVWRDIKVPPGLGCPSPLVPICPGQNLHREGAAGQPSGRTVGLR